MIKDMSFSLKEKNAINSSDIFSYSDEFLKEIIGDLIKLKIQKLSNPKSTEFSNRIKQILGKSFTDKEFEELISSNDEKLKEKILSKFNETRNERIKILGEDYAKDIEKRIFLQSIDLNWKSHIQYLEQLRQVVGLRSYGQRDPLVEYKKEAFDLFSNLLEKLKLDYVTILMNLKVVTEQTKKENNNTEILPQKNQNKKMGRNEPCFCGSGKKFKHCHGAL